MILRHYLSQAVRRGFVWGEHDCILFAAGWVREQCGRDPAVEWRGTYQTEHQARACLQRAGGMETAIHNALSAVGWRRVAAMKPGDVVLVRLPGEDGQDAAGIAVGGRNNDRVALLTRRGLVVAPANVLRAWRHG